MPRWLWILLATALVALIWASGRDAASPPPLRTGSGAVVDCVSPPGSFDILAPVQTPASPAMPPARLWSCCVRCAHAGLLDQIAGRKVTFEISALTHEGKDTQMSIQCNFAELGDCGRKRYDVEAARNNFLFEIEMPNRSAGSFGSISVTPDIAQGKVPVDVFMIRVFVPDAR